MSQPATAQRFSKTVDYYARYRPDYPPQVMAALRENYGLLPTHTIADIGMGTGIFTRHLLENKNTVYGIEPNPEMRETAVRLLADYPHFHAVDGTAESTALPDHSIDFITTAQAFHWFDRIKTRQEFQRILKPHGWVALIWNLRDNSASPFMQAYENLLQTFGTDYKKVAAENTVTPAIIGEFFAPHAVKTYTFLNQQAVDWEGCKGRLLSTSYAPKSGDARFDEMLQHAQEIFHQHANEGKVNFIYNTQVNVSTLI